MLREMKKTVNEHIEIKSMNKEQLLYVFETIQKQNDTVTGMEQSDADETPLTIAVEKVVTP